MQALFNTIFKDKHGNVVIWQWPNLALIGWITFSLLALIFNKGRINTGLGAIATSFIFTWSYLELTKGTNYFRRSIGLIVMVLVVVNFFH